MHKKLFTILIIILILSTLGCSQQNEEINIDEFNISYLEKIDSKYLVGNNVSISVNVPNAKSVQLIIQDIEESEIEDTIEGKKSGQQWLFEYENNDHFTKEIWIVANFNKEQRVSEKKIITNQDQSYESVFENIITINPDKVNLLKQKVNLDIIGWLDNNKILAKDKNSLFLYDIYKNQKDIIVKDVWNIFANYNKNKVIYENEDGIHFLNIQTNEQKKIFDNNKEMILKDLIWSRNENKIILNIIEDDKENLYLINLIDENIKLLELDINYQLGNMIYYDNNYLFCFGKLKLSGDENKNHSEHLLGLNINTKRIKDYTPDIQLVDDLKLLSQINENEFLIQISSATISEDDISSYNAIYILDARKKSLNKYKIELDSPYIFSLSANKNEYIYLSNSRDNGNLKSSEKIIIIGRNNKEDTEILKTLQ